MLSKWTKIVGLFLVTTCLVHAVSFTAYWGVIPLTQNSVGNAYKANVAFSYEVNLSDAGSGYMRVQVRLIGLTAPYFRWIYDYTDPNVSAPSWVAQGSEALNALTVGYVGNGAAGSTNGVRYGGSAVGTGGWTDLGPVPSGCALWFSPGGAYGDEQASTTAEYVTGPNGQEVGVRNVSYSVDAVNTTTSNQVVNVRVAGQVVATKNVGPYKSTSISGVAAAQDGSLVDVTATASLHPQNGMPYDPFLVSAANVSMQRAFFVGSPTSQLVDCEVVVQASNISSASSWVRAFADSMQLGEITIGTDGDGFQFLKVKVPLPIGSIVSMQAQGGFDIINAPPNATVAANNTLFYWIVIINGPQYRPPYDSSYTANTTTTNYSNGQNITQTPAAGGGTSTTVVNVGTIPTTGQTVTPPPAVTAGATGTNGTPGTTIITGSGNGNDTGLLQGILANTAEIARNTKDGNAGNTTEGLVAEMPNENRLTTFSPDQATGNALSSMSPLAGKIIPPGSAPEITLPFGELGIEGFSNQTLSFANTNLDTWAGVIRTFLLFCVSGFFAYHHIKLVSRTLGNV
ncbi:MAG: hypothetical protein HYV95_09365 [Opitutae bacterium]|nr:hypothetical protein [Opitutae bacterium]